MKFLSSLLLLVAPVVLALPTEAPVEKALEARQCFVQCGNNCYSSDDVAAADQAGYQYYSEGSTAGSSSYPHKYNNYEGFTFLVDGPYQEFPILKSGNVYSGGSPGADRVIFNTQGQRAGEITHSGASGNNFVACSGWQ